MGIRLGGWKQSVGLKLNAGAHLQCNEFGELRIWCGLERASGAGEVQNWGWEGKDKEGIWRTPGQVREGFLELWGLQGWRWKLPMCPEYLQPGSTLGSRTDAYVLHCTVVLTGMAFRNTGIPPPFVSLTDHLRRLFFILMHCKVPEFHLPLNSIWFLYPSLKAFVFVFLFRSTQGSRIFNKGEIRASMSSRKGPFQLPLSDESFGGGTRRTAAQ